MNDQAWQNNPLMIATVTLLDHQKMLRFRVVDVVDGKEVYATAWARCIEDVQKELQRRGKTVAKVYEAARDRFHAEIRPGHAFLGKVSKETLYTVESTGDWIIWPEEKTDEPRNEQEG